MFKKIVAIRFWNFYNLAELMEISLLLADFMRYHPLLEKNNVDKFLYK